MYAFVYISDITSSCFNYVRLYKQQVDRWWHYVLYMAISVIRHCSTYNVGTLSEILELNVIKIMRVMTAEIQPLKVKVYSKGSILSWLPASVNSM